MPGETETTIEENLRWTTSFWETRLFDFSFPKFFVPYPGTEIFEDPDKYGVKILHMDWEKYHRWALPRPIEIDGVQEKTFVKELKDLYNVWVLVLTHNFGGNNNEI